MILKVIPCGGKYVELVKVSDDMFEGVHPNGINVGYEKNGSAVFDLEVNYSFKVESLKLDDRQSLMTTSRVEKIISYDASKEEQTVVYFKTANSTYLLIIYND